MSNVPNVDELTAALREAMPELSEEQAKRYATEQADALGLTGRTTCEEVQAVVKSIKDLAADVFKHFRL